MDRIEEIEDLGTASVETQGVGGAHLDTDQQLSQKISGISND